jgi:DNA-directed RNA polymerase subunit K/omega
MSAGGNTLTKFQRVKVMSLRAEQLKNNEFPVAPIPPGVYDHTRMAEIELEAGKLVHPISGAKAGSIFVRDNGHSQNAMRKLAD